MKKILLLICLLSISFISFSQFPTTSAPVGNASTIQNDIGARKIKKGAVVGLYADTLAANADTYVKGVHGIMITTNNGSIFLRDTVLKRWIKKSVDYVGSYMLPIATWSGTGITFDITAGSYYIGQNFYTITNTQRTLSTAHPTLNRIDVIYVDNNNTVGVLTGIPSTTPSKPQINPATQIELTFVKVDAGMTTPIGINNLTIYNENTEWATSTSDVGIVNFNYAANPFVGRKSTRVLRTVSGSVDVDCLYTNGSLVNLSNYDYLKFYIRLNAVYANDAAVFFFISNGITNSNPLSLLQFGLNTTLLNQYQLIVVPVSAFQFNAPVVSINSLNFNLVSGLIDFQIDKVELQGGNNVPPNGGVLSFNTRVGHVVSEKADYAPYFIDSSYKSNDTVYNVKNGVEIFSHTIPTSGGTTNPTLGTLPKKGTGNTFDDSQVSESGGNVGVGTLTPIYKLDVNGTVNATGLRMPTGAGVGKIPVSDANGVLTLKTPQSVNDSINKYAWVKNGNAGTTASSFIGTTDNKDLVFKVGGVESGRINILNGNTSFGISSLPKNTNGVNVAVGIDAMYSNKTGSNNVAIGNGALFSDSSGLDNTAVGAHSLEMGKEIYANTAIGNGALLRNEGSGNLGIGYRAGSYSNFNNLKIFINSTGDHLSYADDTTHSIIFGNQYSVSNTYSQRLKINGQLQINNGTQGAGKVLTSDANGISSWQIQSAGAIYTGSNGIKVNGTNITWDSTAIYTKIQADSTVLATATNSRVKYSDTATMLAPYGNTWKLGGNTGLTSANNKIGTTDNTDFVFIREGAEAGRLGVDNTSFGNQAGSIGVQNTNIGAFAGLVNSTGTNNTNVGYMSNKNTDGGSYTTAIGSATITPFDNSTAIGYGAESGAANTLILGATNGSGFNSDGVPVNVGIGTTTPTEKLEVIGNAKVVGDIISEGRVTTKDITITTGAAQDYVLTSDAVGVATWMPLPATIASTNFVYNEEFTGSTTLAIILANTAISAKYNVFKNGILLPSNQYTVSGTTLTLVSRVAADEISVTYQK